MNFFFYSNFTLHILINHRSLLENGALFTAKTVCGQLEILIKVLITNLVENILVD